MSNKVQQNKHSLRSSHVEVREQIAYLKRSPVLTEWKTYVEGACNKE